MKNLYSKIISSENLLKSWKGFRKGKRGKIDVQEFERHLEDNLFTLYNELQTGTYRHSNYTSFYITDPKLRHIHKAKVRDRIVHHAIYRGLYPIFDKGFIYDSYSCRDKKGTHEAVERLENFARKVSRNYTGPCFALKCDIKKFFDSIDHKILFKIIRKKITDKKTLNLILEIISSYSRERERETSGLPIGNLTSQLFANIYLSELDQFAKHILRIKSYLRYADDFIFLSRDRNELEELIPKIAVFLKNKLKLKLHPNKIIIRKLRQGIDFLGYVVLPHYRILRTKTKKRMLKKINNQNSASYLGLLKHCCGYKLLVAIYCKAK